MAKRSAPAEDESEVKREAAQEAVHDAGFHPDSNSSSKRLKSDSNSDSFAVSNCWTELGVRRNNLAVVSGCLCDGTVSRRAKTGPGNGLLFCDRCHRRLPSCAELIASLHSPEFQQIFPIDLRKLAKHIMTSLSEFEDVWNFLVRSYKAQYTRYTEGNGVLEPRNDMLFMVLDSVLAEYAKFKTPNAPTHGSCIYLSDIQFQKELLYHLSEARRDVFPKGTPYLIFQHLLFYCSSSLVVIPTITHQSMGAKQPEPVHCSVFDGQDGCAIWASFSRYNGWVANSCNLSVPRSDPVVAYPSDYYLNNASLLNRWLPDFCEWAGTVGVVPFCEAILEGTMTLLPKELVALIAQMATLEESSPAIVTKMSSASA